MQRRWRPALAFMDDLLDRRWPRRVRLLRRIGIVGAGPIGKYSMDDPPPRPQTIAHRRPRCSDGQTFKTRRFHYASGRSWMAPPQAPRWILPDAGAVGRPQQEQRSRPAPGPRLRSGALGRHRRSVSPSRSARDRPDRGTTQRRRGHGVRRNARVKSSRGSNRPRPTSTR